MPNKPYLVRAFRAGRDDLRERTPETRGLAGKKVVVLGLGGVGTPAALELARAGVGELCVVDHDVVDAGPVVRYPFGLASVGRPKVEVLRNWILQNIPYTTVSAAKHRLGGVRSPGDMPEGDVIDLAFAGADLVLDTTAEFGLHAYVADLAREHGIPYVEAATRTGAWGGVVARVLPDHNAPCWICYEAQLRDLEEAGNGPAADPAGMTQPTGCADPTFTGVGFDVSEFGLAATRLVVSTLLRGEAGAYPDPGWDIGILNIRERDGSASQPTWTTYSLAHHPTCPRHGARAA